MSKKKKKNTLSTKPKSGVEQRFPTARARDAADAAIDALDPRLPMTDYIDTWYTAYVAAGGKVVGVPA